MTKWSGTSDPRAEDEAQKYDTPVPSRDFLLKLLADHGTPMTHRQVCAACGIFDDERVEALRRRLRAMERDGQLMRNRRDAYGVAVKMDLVTGTLIGHRDGFGFVRPDAGGDDLYVSARQMRLALDGDRVLVRPTAIDARGRQEAVIVEVLERRTRQLVGRFQREHGVGVLIPENRRIVHTVIVPPGEEGDARPGQWVVAALIRQPGDVQQPQARVIEILGDHLAPGMEIEVAIRNYDLPHEWSADLMSAAGRFAPELETHDLEGRFDLRDLPFCTIDGEDARDFDDAILCERRARGGWRLRVAIADVSHYVKPADVLDVEAARRGNSVYFPQHVVPMLPEVLSNGLCSLNPNVDRLALVCDMQITESGSVSKFRFLEAVFRSKARLTYTDVGAYLGGADPSAVSAFRRRHADVAPMLDDMYALYQALRQQREERGAIDFETTETRIVFGADRKIERVVPVVRNDAHRLIEEAMLCANVCAARLLQKHKAVAPFRIHEGPRNEKLEMLRQFLRERGVPFPVREPVTPADYQAVMERIASRPDAAIIQTVMLRSMNQAVYSPENQGHFGLAYPAYTHFTSPIRRYPDLLVHRAIRALIRSGTSSPHLDRPDGLPAGESVTFPYSPRDMAAMSEHCSMTERRADEATRDVMAWLKCEFMQDKIGETFPGVVSAVTHFGVFVALDELHVEGLIHISALDNDYYHFDATRHRLTGERNGLQVALGDRVMVRVVRVSLDDRKIDFEWVQGHRDGKARPGAKVSPGAGKTPSTGKGRKPGQTARKSSGPSTGAGKAPGRGKPSGRGKASGAGKPAGRNKRR